MMTNFDSQTVEKIIGYEFSDKRLLRQAFVHSSYANENGESGNERLEYLGDAVLELIVREKLLAAYPDKQRGDLSKMSDAVVSTASLKTAVKKMGVNRFLLVSEGQSGIGNSSSKIHANLFEAVLAAVYLDGGRQAAEKFVFDNLSEAIVSAESFVDYTTWVQEYCQRLKKLYNYESLSKSGPDNSPTFHYKLQIAGTAFFDGYGGTIKEAKAACAKAAYKVLTKDTESEDKQ